MKVIDVQNKFPNKIISIDLADRAFDFSPEQREALRSIEITSSDCKLLDDSNSILVPFSGACVHELSKVTFEQIRDQAMSLNTIRSVARSLTRNEMKQFRISGWDREEETVSGIDEKICTYTKTLDNFLSQRVRETLLEDEHITDRKQFLMPTPALEDEPIMKARSEVGWLLVHGKEEVPSRPAKLNEIVACAMAAAAVGTNLGVRIGNALLDPIYIQRQQYTSDSTGRVYPSWKLKISEPSEIEVETEYKIRPLKFLLSNGDPVPVMGSEQIGVKATNHYFRSGDSRKNGHWLGVGCTAGSGTVMINSDTYSAPTPAVLKLKALTDRG